MKCKKCGHKMTVYYGEKCFRCNKPSGESRTVYNLIEVLHYLEHKRAGLYDRIWDSLCEAGQIDNDCCRGGLFDEDLIEDYPDNEALVEDLKLLLAEFPLASESLWEISW